MLTITYLYTLKLNNDYLSIYSEDSTMSVLKEYPGAQLVSKECHTVRPWANFKPDI